MDHLPGDGGFDKVMVFFSNWAHPISEEWFKLMEWLLITSALSFAAQQSKNSALYVLPVISVVLIWLRIMVDYNARFHEFIGKDAGHLPHGPAGSAKHVFLWGLGAIAISAFASLMGGLAWGFASQLSAVLNG